MSCLLLRLALHMAANAVARRRPATPTEPLLQRLIAFENQLAHVPQPPFACGAPRAAEPQIAGPACRRTPAPPLMDPWAGPVPDPSDRLGRTSTVPSTRPRRRTMP